MQMIQMTSRIICCQAWSIKRNKNHVLFCNSSSKILIRRVLCQLKDYVYVCCDYAVVPLFLFKTYHSISFVALTRRPKITAYIQQKLKVDTLHVKMVRNRPITYHICPSKYIKIAIKEKNQEVSYFKQLAMCLIK